jgi:hypothetical protein
VASRVRKTSLSALLETLGGGERIQELQLDGTGGLVRVVFFPPPPPEVKAEEQPKPAEPKDWRFALEQMEPVDRMAALERGLGRPVVGDPFGSDGH